MLKSIDERIVELTRSVLDAAQADAEKIAKTGAETSVAAAAGIPALNPCQTTPGR